MGGGGAGGSEWGEGGREEVSGGRGWIEVMVINAFVQEIAESDDWLQSDCPCLSPGSGASEFGRPVSPPLDVLLVSRCALKVLLLMPLPPKLAGGVDHPSHGLTRCPWGGAIPSFC